MYADTDFFLALLKQSDWLKPRAVEIQRRHKAEIWTAAPVMIELLLLAERYRIDPESIVIDALQLARFDGDQNAFLLAAHYMKDGLGVFDALHAAHCGADRIISSDHVFDRIGLDRVRLEP